MMPRRLHRPTNPVARLLAAALFIIPVCVPGCDESQPNTAATRTASDPVMAAAEDQGRSTFPAFLRAFASPEPGWGNFQIRHAYTTENGFVDHIWLDLESVGENTRLFCTVPIDEDERAIRFQPGAELTIDPGTVSDWLFIDSDGTFVGGYTLRVTMDRIGNTHDDTDDDMHGGIRFRDLEGTDPATPAED